MGRFSDRDKNSEGVSPRRCLFLTAGDPTRPTGGNLYNQHLARALANRGIAVSWHVARSSGPLPSPGDVGRLISDIAVERPDVIVIDSIALACAIPLCISRRGNTAARGRGDTETARPGDWATGGPGKGIVPAPSLPVAQSRGDGGAGLAAAPYRRVPASPRPPVSPHPRLVALLHYLPSHYPGYSWLRRQISAQVERIVLRRVDLVVSMSGAARRHCLAAGAPPDCTVVAPPGRPEILPTLPAERAAGGGTRFLSVANWLPAKGVHTVVTAFDRLNDPNSTLTLVGSQDVAPAYTGQVRRLIAASRQRDRIIAPGSVSPDEVAAHYRAADVFVLASRSETFGTVVVEAMAAGLPVVASRLDSLAALIDDGTSGYLVPPGSVDVLAEHLAGLAADPALRGVMGRAARARVERYPTWPDTMDSLVRLITGLV